MPTTVYFATNRVVTNAADAVNGYEATMVPPSSPQAITYGTAFVDGVNVATGATGVVSQINNVVQGQFSQQAIDDLSAPGRNLLVFIHGFDNSFSDAIVTSGANLSQNHRFEFPYDVAGACSLDPVEDAAVLGPIKAKPFGWPRKPRPALTGPARDGVRPRGRDERMLAARIEPKNGLQIQTAGFRVKSDWR
jgi:hypothetical protein